MSQKLKTRDYLFDNYKAILIFLVVLGHFIEPCWDNNGVLVAMKWGIVSFHMPAFIFISGYFSKRELSIGTLVQRLAVPYLACEVIYYLFYILILHKETGLYLLRPKFSLWYLLALFVWRLITPYIKKIPHHMMLAFVAGLLIGCSDMPDNFLSIPRILVFYPYFLAGMYFDRELITRFRNRMTERSAAVVTILTLFFVCFGPLTGYSTKIFYGRYNYASLEQTTLEGILCRILCYLIGFIFTYALLFLVSEKQHNYSYLGTRTMGIYLFHGLTYNYLKDCTNLLANVNTAAETVLLVLSCLAVTWIFSHQSFTDFTNTFSKMPIPKHPKPIPVPSYLYYPMSLA